ncbi:MAG: TRAP transporter substrate-binding protein [Janthinobacterium lividum]
MQTSRRTILKAATAATAASAVTGIGLIGLGGKSANAQSGTFSFKVGTNVQNTHPIFLRLSEATEKIKADTDGKVAIRVFPNGQLGSDTDMLSQVRSGGVDFLTMPGVVLANLVPMASLNSVGFAFPDYPAVWKAMDGEMGKFMRSHIAKANLHVFDRIWDNGFRHITANKPINTPADLNELKIRVPVSPLLLSLFKTLKASPTGINFNELYSSLQTRLVDAQENPLPIIESAKIYEVQKNCALTGHVWDGYWMLANRRGFESLPTNLREIVARNFDMGAMNQRADSEKLAVSLQQELGSKGLAFHRPPVEPFRAALRQGRFYLEWKAKFGDEAWAQLEAATGKLA